MDLFHRVGQHVDDFIVNLGMTATMVLFLLDLFDSCCHGVSPSHWLPLLSTSVCVCAASSST